MKPRSTYLILLLLLQCGAIMAQLNQSVARTPALNHDWRPGFVSITELTGAIGLGKIEAELSKNYYGITTVAGYQFTRNMMAGAGAGVHVHNGGVLLPLYLDMRLSMNAQEVVPFVAGAGGVTLDLTDLNATSVFINPMMGIRYVAARKTTISLSTGVMVMIGGPNQRNSFVNFKLGLGLKGK